MNEIGLLQDKIEQLEKSAYSKENEVPRDVLDALLPSDDVDALVVKSKRDYFEHLVCTNYGGDRYNRLEQFLDFYDGKTLAPFGLLYLASPLLLLFLSFCVISAGLYAEFDGWLILLASFFFSVAFGPLPEIIVYRDLSRKARSKDSVYLVDVACYWKSIKGTTIIKDRDALKDALWELEAQHRELSFVDITNDNGPRIDKKYEVEAKIKEVKEKLDEIDAYIDTIDHLVSAVFSRSLPLKKDPVEGLPCVDIPNIDDRSYKASLDSVTDYLHQLDKL